MTPFPKTGKLIGREYVSGEEDSIIGEMIQELKEEVSKLYKDKKMLRQIHTKMHGCVKGTFTIDPDLPSNLKQGIFRNARSFDAWIRFSNSNSKPQPDSKKDIRGIAIKIVDVPGEKLLTDEWVEDTQDFVLMSSETFFAKNLHEFRKLLKGVAHNNKLAVAAYFLNPMHWGVLARLLKSNIRCRHPFEIPYWSTQPYQFGDENTAVKYFLKPSVRNKLVYSDPKDENFLRKNMVRTLEVSSVGFDFYVQFQTDADKMPIEDPTVKWDSPFVRLAHLEIPQQDFDSPAQRDYGEYLAFNAWHSLPEHRPLGSFNRARRRVYNELARYRHEWNKQTTVRPPVKEAEAVPAE